MKITEKNGLPEIYKYYKSKFSKEERNTSAIVDYKKFCGILRDFNKEVASIIINEGLEFKLPQRLGYIRVLKYKPRTLVNPDGTIKKKSLNPDWCSSKKLWKEKYPGKTPEELKLIKNKPIVYFLNEHTNGYKHRFYWYKKGSNAKNRSVYSMITTFSNKRMLGKVLQSDNHVDYYE